MRPTTPKGRAFGILFLAMSLLVTGCAQTAARGAVAMKGTEGTAHVSLGRHDVESGDKVVFYRNHCEPPVAKKQTNCSRKEIGTGTVTELLNEDYSVVRVSPGVAFREGDEVQVKR